MASPERKAWRILRSLDVDYVFVLFGGYIGWVQSQPVSDVCSFALITVCRPQGQWQRPSILIASCVPRR